jgi:YD repeat-containing protein
MKALRMLRDIWLVGVVCVVSVWAQPDWAAASQRAVLQADWVTVAEVAQQWKQHDPNATTADWLLGYSGLATGDYNRALAGFLRLDDATKTRAILEYASMLANQSPENAAAQMLKGDALARTGDYAAALTVLDKATQIDPDSALIFDVRGMVRSSAGKVDGALADFEKATKLKPDFADAHANRGLSFLHAGNLPAAIESFTTALDKAPANPIALTGRGVAHTKQGNWKAARADFLAAIKARPDFIPAAADLRYAERARAEVRLYEKLESDQAAMTVSIKTFFDDQGRLAKAVYPDGSELRYEFDPRGNLEKITDSKLGTTVYQHNELNQLRSVLYPNGRRFSFGYDPTGRLSSVTYPDGEKVSIAYDPQRRAITVRDSTKVTEQIFDASGRLAQLKAESGALTSFHYDTAGRLSAIKDQHGVTLNDLDVRMRYLDDGRLKAIASPFGSQMSRYDANGQLLKVEMDAGLKVFYDRLPNGDLLVTSPLGFSRFDKSDNLLASMTVEGIKDTFEWNPQGRLLRSSGLLSGTTKYNWSGDTATVISPTGLIHDLRVDKVGRLESMDIFGRQFRVGYDAMGNANRALGFAGQTFAELKYHYDSRGRIERLTIPDWNRYGKQAEALMEFGAKNPVPSAEWLKRYDAAWSQAYPSSPPKSLDQLAADFERWPEEVMQVQANVFGLMFLTMVARPAGIVSDWISKPTGLSLALSGIKQIPKALTKAGIRNLEKIPEAGELAAWFNRADSFLSSVETISSWGSFGRNLGRAIAPSMAIGWRLEGDRYLRVYERTVTKVEPRLGFGNPPALEPSGQYTWLHPYTLIQQYRQQESWEAVWMRESLGLQINLGRLWAGARNEVIKKGINMAVSYVSKNGLERMLGLSSGTSTNVGSLPAATGASSTTSPSSVPKIQGSQGLPNNSYGDLNQLRFVAPSYPGLVPVPTKQYELKLQQQWQQWNRLPGGVIFLDFDDEEELDMTDVLGEEKKVPVPKEPIYPFLILPTARYPE